MEGAEDLRRQLRALEDPVGEGGNARRSLTVRICLVVRTARSRCVRWLSCGCSNLLTRQHDPVKLGAENRASGPGREAGRGDYAADPCATFHLAATLPAAAPSGFCLVYVHSMAP